MDLNGLNKYTYDKLNEIFLKIVPIFKILVLLQQNI